MNIKNILVDYYRNLSKSSTLNKDFKFMMAYEVIIIAEKLGVKQKEMFDAIMIIRDKALK